jgi:serine protease Do
VAILSDAQGIGFAIPIRLVSAALSEMFTPESSGKALWFGARVRVGQPPLTIMSVQPLSPAGKAGLKPGDHILQVNGVTPKGFIDFNEMLVNNSKPDISVVVENEEGRHEAEVRLVSESAFFNSDLIQRLIGVKLGRRELKPELARFLGLISTEGVVITEVDPGTPAAESLEPGYLITRIDGQTPTDVVAAAKLLYGKKTGEKVRLDVVAQQRRGSFISYNQGSIELPVR